VLLTELGINALFVYQKYPLKRHEECMCLLHEAGIYVLANISAPSICVNRSAPHQSCAPQLLDHYPATADTLTRFPNTLGLCVANELVNDVEALPARPVIRNVIQYLKSHMQDMLQMSKQRVVPLCINDPDFKSQSTDSLAYFTTQARESESIDLYCFTAYN